MLIMLGYFAVAVGGLLALALGAAGLHDAGRAARRTWRRRRGSALGRSGQALGRRAARRLVRSGQP